MPEDISSTERGQVRLLPITAPVVGTCTLGDWTGHGLCVGVDPEAFFPSHGDPGTEARQVCAGCRVRDECLDCATAADEFGIWGGLDQQERRKLKRRERRQAAAQFKDNRADGAA